MNTDLSSGALNVPNFSQDASPYEAPGYEGQGGAWRGIFSDWFGADDIAWEDWKRGEQSADLAFQRDMYQNQYNNEFQAKYNTSEREATQAWQEKMRDSQVESYMNQLKKAGINPILAAGSFGGSTSVPSGSAGSVSGSSGSRGSSYGGSSAGQGSSRSFGSMMVGLMKIVAGAVSGQPGPVISGITDMSTSVRTSYNSKGKVTGTHTTTNKYARDYTFKK